MTADFAMMAASVLAILIIIFHFLPPTAMPQLAGFPEGWDYRVDDRAAKKPWEEFVFFKKGGGSAPSPDPQIGAAALKQAETGQQWLDFAKDQFNVGNQRQAEMDELSKRLQEQQLGIADQQQAWATADRERYETVFKPIEDEFIDQAKNYASPEKQAEAAAEARADVTNSAATAQAANRRTMAAMGVNPASGRFAGVERATDLGTALAAAGAQNTARTQVRDKGLALKADIANMGRGLPAQAAQATTLGLGAGQAAMGTAGQANANFYQNTGIMGQGYGGAMQGYAGQASALNQQYGTQVQAWAAQQQANAASSAGIGGGLGSLLGTGIGAFAAFSSETLKEDKQPVDGALDAIKSMPVEKWKYKEGVSDEGEHIGPYAEDFQQATGLGDGTMIKHQDAIGLMMKGIQELDQKVDKIDSAKPAARTAAKKPAKQKEVAA